MITDKAVLKMKLRDAVNCSLITCDSVEELTAVAAAIVEFFCAIGMDDDDYVEVLSNCEGMDVETNNTLDVLIAEFSE